MKKAVRVSLLVAAAALVLSACGGELQPSSFPGVAVEGQSGYLTSNQYVYKFDPTSGTQTWLFPPTQDDNNPRGPFAGAPVKLGDVIIVGGTLRPTGAPDTNLYGLSDQDGSEVWRFSGARKEYADGASTDGTLIFAPNGDNTLYALDPSQRNGAEPRLIWTFTATNKLWARPLVADGKVYQPSLDHNLYALDAATGKELWRFTTEASLASTPVLKDGLLYFGSFDQRMYAVDAESGKEVWRTERLEGWIWCDALVDGNEIFVGDVKGKFYAIDVQSGRVLWTSQLGGAVHGQPVIHGNKIYVVSFDSYVYSFDRQPAPDTNGNVPATRVIENGLVRRLLSTPAIAGGALLVPLFDGDVRLVAINLENNTKKYEFPPKPVGTATP